MSASADAAEIGVGPAGVAPASGPSMGMMVVAMIVTALLTVGGVAGVLMYLAKAGKLGGGTSAAAAVAKEEKPATHAVVLEPMLVNLADADGHAYLRAAVTLRVEDAPKDARAAKPKEGEAKEAKGSADAPVRDAVLEVLGRQTSEDLLVPEGKERLKKELKEALTTRVSEAKVAEIYFTDFLVQR